MTPFMVSLLTLLFVLSQNSFLKVFVKIKVSSFNR